MKTNIINSNFFPEEFVLVRRALEEGHKLNFCWIGPGPLRAINAISKLV